MIGKALKITLTVLMVGGVTIAGAATSGVLAQPTVETVNNRWGNVTQEMSEIQTAIVLNNPNPVGLPLGSVGVNYTASMNDVTMATGAKHGITIESGTNEIDLSTHLNNSKIPEWWMTHINNGEQTVLTISPTVTADLPMKTFSIDVPEQNREISTDLLAPLNSDEDQDVEALGQTLLTVEQTRGDWGTATREETPMDISATVENPNYSPVMFSKIGYTVTMNNVTVATGESEEEITIAPQSTETIETTAVINNPRLDDWWVTHLQNNEKTQMNVEFYAVMEYGGQQQKIPLDFFTYEEQIETDMLGSK